VSTTSLYINQQVFTMTCSYTRTEARSPLRHSLITSSSLCSAAVSVHPCLTLQRHFEDAVTSTWNDKCCGNGLKSSSSYQKVTEIDDLSPNYLKNEILGFIFEAHCIRQCEYPLLRVIQSVDRLKGEKETYIRLSRSLSYLGHITTTVLYIVADYTIRYNI